MLSLNFPPHRRGNSYFSRQICADEYDLLTAIQSIFDSDIVELSMTEPESLKQDWNPAPTPS